MRDRQSIIGFTEAELGFFAAILLLAVFLEHRHRSPTLPTPHSEGRTIAPEQTHARIVSLERRLAELQSSRSQLMREREKLETEIQRIKGLRSRQKPSCRERGVTKDFLFNVTVEGSNSFKIGETVTNLAGLLRSAGARLELAKQADCVESVRIFYDYGRVSLAQAVIARRSLQEHFYTAEPERSGDGP
jgi:hypothetical protein